MKRKCAMCGTWIVMLNEDDTLGLMLHSEKCLENLFYNKPKFIKKIFPEIKTE